MSRRAFGAVLGAGLLAACVTDGTGTAGGSGIRWSGPASQGPYARSPYGSAADPFSSWFGGSSGGRTFRPTRNVICDRSTQTCYRGGEIDASETRDQFGRRAAREVDRVRDSAGTNRIYRVDDDVVCNRREKVCYKNGRPDRSETRDFFGRKLPR